MFALVVALLIGCLGACGSPSDSPVADAQAIVGQWQFDLETTRARHAETRQQSTQPVDGKIHFYLGMMELEARHGWTIEFKANHTLSTWRTGESGNELTSEGTWRGQDGDFWMDVTKMSGVPESMWHPEEAHLTIQGDRLIMANNTTTSPFAMYMKRKK